MRYIFFLLLAFCRRLFFPKGAPLRRKEYLWALLEIALRSMVIPLGIRSLRFLDPTPANISLVGMIGVALGTFFIFCVFVPGLVFVWRRCMCLWRMPAFGWPVFYLAGMLFYAANPTYDDISTVHAVTLLCMLPLAFGKERAPDAMPSPGPGFTNGGLAALELTTQMAVAFLSLVYGGIAFFSGLFFLTLFWSVPAAWHLRAAAAVKNAWRNCWNAFP